MVVKRIPVVLALLGVLSAGGLCFAVARTMNRPAVATDHFLSYKTKTTKGTAPFELILRLRLADRYEDRRFDVLQPRDLLVPADEDGRGIGDARIHLQAYAIRVSTVCTTDARPCSTNAECGTGAKCKRPAHVKRLGQTIVDEFGSHTIDAIKPELLLVPSLKSVTGTPSPPVPSEYAVDHYKCYKAKLSKGSSKLPKGTQITLQDQFTIPPKRFTVGAPTHICTPVDKNSEGFVNAAGHLLCYKVKPAKGAPKHIKRKGVGINNQLGPLTRDTEGERALCVPAVSSLATPVPTSGTGATVTPTANVGPTATPSPSPSQSPGIPPDPSSVAPPIKQGIATTVVDATAFLYTGPNPIQTGVAPGAIEPVRAAVVRGKVLDPSQAPLAGVTIVIRGHPELGQTRSRLDGMFDMVVNGGGLLTIHYQKTGLLPAERQVDVPWQAYVVAPDVMLVALDARVTTIDLGSAAVMREARGTVTSDADGVRQPMLLFPAGTQAEMVMPDGSTHPLASLAVRATEYTVGPKGPNAMPGELPATSVYTYAVELSADEALAEGATDVRFNQPLPFYLENLIGVPVGSVVPAGYYDRARSRWVASENGTVVKILAETDGLALLDTDGDAAADGPQTLADLGVSDDERQRLATLYEPGQTLWRVPIAHFTPYDLNWALRLPDDSQWPRDDGDDDDGDPDPKPKDDKPKNPCERSGSIVDCHSQVLREAVDLVGVPFDLHYASDRVPAWRASETLAIDLTDASPPPSLRAVHLEVRIAGRTFTERFDPAPDLKTTFTWDRRDVYGRTLNGRQLARVRIGYEYVQQYAAVPTNLRDSLAGVGLFGVASGGGSGGGGGGGGAGAGLKVSDFVSVPPRATADTIVLWSNWDRFLGGWDARGYGLGGWSLGVHHGYDPVNRVLYLGDGTRREAEVLPDIITTVAGTGAPPLDPPLELYVGEGFALGPDGSLYATGLGTGPGPSIHRVRPDRTHVVVAGGGEDEGDGVPATSVKLRGIRQLAVGPDGSLYFVSSAGSGGRVVRRVAPDGTLTTVAGFGGFGNDGDGGPATQARFYDLQGIALGPDGSLYLADPASARVRRVGPDGIITTVAGTGDGCPFTLPPSPCGNGGLATAARLSQPIDVAVGSDGVLYIADWFRVHRVDPNGILTTIAGTGAVGGSADGVRATSVSLNSVDTIAIAPDGSVFFSEGTFPGESYRVRRVALDGLLTTIAGNGLSLVSGDGGPATAAGVSSLRELAVGPDVAVYGGGVVNGSVRRVAPALPSFSAFDLGIPADDGRELYVFDASGRHLRTLDALTGAVHWTFTYDAAGRLAIVEDGDGNTTSVERDGSGTPQAIVSADGHRSTLAVDDAGWLQSVTNPGNAVVGCTHATDGLLTGFRDLRGGDHGMTYDAGGRLLTDTNPAGGSLTLARTELPAGAEVDVTTKLGRTTQYRFEELSDRTRTLTTTSAAGTQVTTALATNGIETTTLADGTVYTARSGPDPRFAMMAPILTSLTIRTPAGRQRTSTQARTVTRTDPADVLSLTAQTDTLALNGRIATRVYGAATRTHTLTTAEGRTLRVTLDPAGRTAAVKLGSEASHTIGRDARGRIVSVGHGARVYAFAYDAAGFVSQVTSPAGRELAIGRDAAGHSTSLTRDGSTISLGRDAAGNLTSLTLPGGIVHGFEHTAADVLAKYLPPAIGLPAPDTVFGYDLDGAVTSMTRAGVAATLGYDAGGRLSLVTHAHDVVSVGYDAAGRATTIATSGGVTLTHGFDGPLLTATTWSGPVAGSVERAYDDDFRTSTIVVNGGAASAYAYDNDGLVTQAGALVLERSADSGRVTGTTLGTSSETFAYDAFGDVVDHRVLIGLTETFHVHYDRGPSGEVTTKTESIAGEPARSFGYVYDALGRLSEVRENSTLTATYAYDVHGNRASVRRGETTTTASYDAQDRLLAYGTISYDYDAAGTLETRTQGNAITTYDADALGALRAVTLPGGSTIQYTIDGLGRRIGKRVDGALEHGLLYDDRLRPIAELDGTGAVSARFVYGRSRVPDSMVKGGSTYRIVRDQLDSVRLVIDAASGTIAQRLDYDEFGIVRTDTNPGFQPFGFAGGLYDPDTGLVRFGARDYDSEIGRWNAKDPRLFSAADTVLYAYAFNDPVNYVDPTGEFAVLFAITSAAQIVVTAAVITGAVVVASYALHTAYQHLHNGTTSDSDRPTWVPKDQPVPNPLKPRPGEPLPEGLRPENTPKFPKPPPVPTFPKHPGPEPPPVPPNGCSE